MATVQFTDQLVVILLIWVEELTVRSAVTVSASPILTQRGVSRLRRARILDWFHFRERDRFGELQSRG